MNNYINELIDICKLPFEEVAVDYKIIQLGSKAIYISNYLKIVEYGDSLVVLKVKNNLLEIKGDNLKIKQINKSEIVLKGNIISCGLGMFDEKVKL